MVEVTDSTFYHILSHFFHFTLNQIPQKLRDNCSKQSQPQTGPEVLSSHPLAVFEDSVVVTGEQ